MFGLGLYLYAGEDLPEEVEKPKVLSKDQFEKAQLLSKTQIQTVLDKFEMSEKQRNTLEILL
jgi:hypothetical protein